MAVLISLLVMLRDCVRSRAALQLEVLALQHQLRVLQRAQSPRLRLTPVDRLLWVWLSRTWSQWRTALRIVKPETVIAWHRRGFRLFWAWKSRHKPGRPTVPQEVRTLIRTMSTANPLWGSPRIHGELLKLGFTVSQTTVATYMTRSRPLPSQTWRTFLTNHTQQLVAADFFVVPTATCRLLFVLVLLAHDRRRVVSVAVTEHPTAVWTAQQFRDSNTERNRSNSAGGRIADSERRLGSHSLTKLIGRAVGVTQGRPEDAFRPPPAEASLSIRRTRTQRIKLRGSPGWRR